jgi:hypothetical protein
MTERKAKTTAKAEPFPGSRFCSSCLSFPKGIRCSPHHRDNKTFIPRGAGRLFHPILGASVHIAALHSSAPALN